MNCIVCGKRLRKHNTIGTCRQHRGQSAIRRAYEKGWQIENSERYAEAKKQWGRKHPEYYAKWRNADPNRKIAHALRTRLNRAVKGKSAVRNLGCSIPEFLQHLESKFLEGMSWENYGKWHIDHIRPLSSFNLQDTDELAQACHYSNLQPLWGADNISKNAKLDWRPKSA